MKGKGWSLRGAVFTVLAASVASHFGCVEEERPPFIPIPEVDKIKISRELREKLLKLPLNLKWDTYVLAGELITRVTAEEDLLLIETKQNRIWVLDRNKGVVRWVYDSQYPLRFRPAVAPDLIYFISRDVIHAVFRNGGDVKWKKKLPFVQGSPAAANAFHLFVAAGETPRFTAFKEATQVPKLEGGQYLGSAEAVADWFINTGSFVRAAPIEVTKGNTSTVYISSFDHKTYAMDGSTGKVTWIYQTGQEILCEPFVRGDWIFIGGMDHTLHCLNRYGGPPAKWLFPTGGPIEMSPAGDDDYVYARAEKILDEYGQPEDSYLLAIEVKTGKERWRFRRGLRMLISGKSKVYILREGNVLVVLEKDTGKFLGEFPLPDFHHVLTNVEDDILYLVTDRGFIFALQESNPNPFR